MSGCGVVLAIYRLNTPAQASLVQSTSQLGFGLAYGTAASGLALFLWRWRTGSGPLPTQPGHWLLVFGAVGLVIDVTTSAAFLLGVRLALAQTFAAFLYQQLAAWGTATLIGLVVLLHLRGAPPFWTAAAVILVTAIGLNAVADVVCLLGIATGSGTWSYDAPVWTQMATTALGLAAIWSAELTDRISRVPRDWLHLGGIAAISALGLVNLATGAALWLSQ
jgi:hypothetical protein